MMVVFDGCMPAFDVTKVVSFGEKIPYFFSLFFCTVSKNNFDGDFVYRQIVIFANVISSVKYFLSSARFASVN